MAIGQVEEQIAQAMVDDLKDRAKAHGVKVFQDVAPRSRDLGDQDLSGATVGGFGVTATTDERCIIFNTLDGEPRVIPVIYLAKTLRKRRNGQPAFVAADPETGLPMSPVPEYVPGTMKCFLHPDHPGRDELRAMGIGSDLVCGDNETKPAGGFKTAFDLRQHEEKRHPRSWAIRKDWQERQDKLDDRNEQRRLADAMLAAVGASGKRATTDGPRPIHFCEAEECERFFDSGQGLAIHMTKEHRNG